MSSFVLDDTLTHAHEMPSCFSASQSAFPTSPDMAWATDIATHDGYDIKLDGDSFQRFMVKHSASGASGVRGMNRLLASSIFDYSAEGIAGITCRYCGNPRDDRPTRRLESDTLPEDIVETEEFEKFEKALCAAIISKGEYSGASGCHVTVTDCEEGYASPAAAIQSYLVKDMRAAPQEGVLFVLENGN